MLLATPTNLIAIARTVAAVWRQERLAKEARQIGELGKELYERLAKAADDLRKVGGGLSTAVNNYNSFVSSFETRSLVTARKFRELNIEPGRRGHRCSRLRSRPCRATRRAEFGLRTTRIRRRSLPNRLALAK